MRLERGGCRTNMRARGLCDEVWSKNNTEHIHHDLDRFDLEPPCDTIFVTSYLVNLAYVSMVHALRGGVDNDRAQDTRYRQDHRREMVTWALQKLTDKLPHFPQATAAMLMKAENRTAQAVLNAKSPTRMEEVLIAALRRAALPPYDVLQQGQQHNLPELAQAMEQQASALTTLAKSLVGRTYKAELA